MKISEHSTLQAAMAEGGVLEEGQGPRQLPPLEPAGPLLWASPTLAPSCSAPNTVTQVL